MILAIMLENKAPNLVSVYCLKVRLRFFEQSDGKALF